MADSKKHQDDLKRLHIELEKSLDWGSVVDWHSSMFKELSELIHAASQIKLSPATLKRFFGVVNHSGSPSVTTLDALSQFVGYDNWREFKIADIHQVSNRKPIIPKKYLYLLASSILAFSTFFLISNKRFSVLDIPEKVPFSSQVLTNTYPNSVIFDFDVSELPTDDLLIQQYWDESKTISIRSDQQQATGIYYFPGYFRAKLVANGQIVQEHDLFLKSNGWLGTIEYQPVPKYFLPDTNEEAVLSYPQELVQELSDSREPLMMVYHYINDLGNVSADHFHLQATVRHTSEETWAVCQTSQIYVIGTEGAMIIPFSKLGCSSDNFLMLNDYSRSGKEHDLSAFGTELGEYTDLEIFVEKQVVSVRIKGVEVYQAAYQESMGNLVGLRFKFLGMGEVKSFSLQDQQGNEIAL